MSTPPQQRFAIPDQILSGLLSQLEANDIILCPVVTKQNSHHLHFSTAPFHRQEMHAFSPVPPPNCPCWLVFPNGLNRNGQRFLGRIIRVAEYQQTRIIVLVQHIQSLGILSLTIPYEYFDGDTSSWWGQMVWSVVSRIKLLRRPDSEDYLSGKWWSTVTDRILTTS